MGSENLSLLNEVLGVLADALRVDTSQLDAQMQMNDLPEWDSMGHMEVMVALEKAYGVEINADTIQELISVTAICKHVEEKKNG